MATDTVQRGSPEPNPARAPRGGGRVVEYQQYIDTQLGRTRRRVKWVDLWTSLALLAAGVTAYLLLAAVVDHWIVPGGLGTAGRWLLLIGLLGGIALHAVAVVAPFLFRRVNPVYAAAALEHGGSMKNTLINFLLLRKQSTAVSDGVLEAMKEQAAVRLAGVPSDAPVDRTALLRWCYVLAAVLIGALGYAMVAPKNSFRSIQRVLSPWADLAAPTRVRIESVDPGDAERRRDDVVTVSLRAAGIRSGDAVTLFFSPTGNAADDVPLPMQSDAAGYLWKTVLPPGSEGLKQDLFYYIQAGDAETPRYRLKVLATPVINVRAVRFDYPAYTGLPPRTVERQGDLQALEGTRITLTAEANQPIRAAHVAFDRARNKDVALQVDGLTATGGFDLTLLNDRTTPAHTSYVLRFANLDGEENPKPVEHKIEVTADQPPEVRVVEPNTPPDKELSLTLGGLLRVTAAARDPDFQLGELTVVLRKAGGLLREERLLSEPRYGEFSNTLVLNAERYNLRVGEKFTFRVRAADNKSTQPNVVETKDYTVVVTPPTPGQPPQQDPRQNPQPNPQQGNADSQNRNPPNAEGRTQANGANQPGGANQPNGANPPANEPNREQNGQPQQGRPGGGDQQPGNPQQGNPPPGGGNQAGGQPQEGNPQPNGSTQPNGNQAGGDQRQPGEQNRPGEQPQNGANQNGGERGPNGGSQQPEQPIDPNVDPGKAFEELQKHFEKQEPQNGAGQPPPQPQEGSGAQQLQNGNQPQNQPPQEGNQSGGGNTQSGGGAPSGGAQPQQSPGGGPAGNEQKSGGSEGTGRSQSNAPPGNEAGNGAGPQNQPAQKTGDADAKPGGEGGAPSTESKTPGAERRPGEANGPGREERRPDGDLNDGTGAPAGSQPQPGAGNPAAGTPSTNEATNKPDPSQPGEKPQAGQPQPDGEQRPNGQPNAGQPSPNRSGNPDASGAGSQAGGDAPQEGKAPRPGEKPDNPQAGKPSVNEGNPAGNAPNPGGREGQAPAGEGSPGQEETAKPRHQKSANEAASEGEGSKEEGKQPSHSKTESDAQGGTSGDRSAKQGEEGGGQRSQQSGTGAAGQNQVGEQGGGTSNQPGGEATSNQPGDQVRSGDRSQGKPGTQSGTGTKSQTGGNQPGGEAASRTGPSAAGRPNAPPQPSQQQAAGTEAGGSQRSSQNGAPPGGGNPNGSGGPPDQAAADRNRDPGTMAGPADPANLQYAEKVTDLTLDRLKQQLDQGRVDPELLKRFTSREALEEFARRWDSMRKNAKEPGADGDAARRQLQENLKSLGLQPRTTAMQGSTAAGGDDARDQRGGTRSEPPAKYRDLYRAYTTGVGQGEK